MIHKKKSNMKIKCEVRVAEVHLQGQYDESTGDVGACAEGGAVSSSFRCRDHVAFRFCDPP